MDVSAASRFTIARANWQMFLDNPLGVGYGGNVELSPRYMPQEVLTNGRRSAHNTMMAVLVDHGVIGLALFSALLLWAIASLLRLRTRAGTGLSPRLSGCRAAVGVGIVAFIAAGQFVNLFKAEVVLWLISMVAVLSAAARDEQASSAA